MNYQQSFLFLLTIPSLLLLSPQISIASTNSESKVTETQPLQLSQIPNKEREITAHVLGGIAVSFAKLGDFNRALEIAQSIKSSVRVYVLRNIAIELAATGKVEQALTISDNQDDASSQGQILEGIVRGLGTKGELTPALVIAESIEDESLRTLAVVNLVFSLIEAEKFPEGVEATKFLANSFDDTHTNYFRSITSILISAKQLDYASQVVEILNLQTDNKNAVAVASELHSLIKGKLAISQVEAGNINEALKVTESLDIKHKSDVFGSVAKALVKSGDANGALDFVQSLEGGYVNRVLGDIAVALAEEGNVDKAIELASSLPESERLFVITGVAHALVEQGEFNRAAQLVKSIPDHSSWYSVSVAAKLAKKGRTGQAIEIAQSLQEEYKYSILAKVAASFAEQGNINRAKEIIESFDEEQPKYLRKVIAELVDRESLVSAQQLTQLLPNNFLKATVLTQLANGYIKAGEKEQAKALLNQASSVEMLKQETSVL